MKIPALIGSLLCFSLFISAQHPDSIFFISLKDSTKTWGTSLPAECNIKYVYFPSQVFLLIGSTPKGALVKKHFYDCNLGEEGIKKKMEELIKVDKDKTLSNEEKEKRYREISFVDTVTVPWADIDKIKIQVQSGSKFAKGVATALVVIGAVGLTFGYLTLIDGRATGGGALALGSLAVLGGTYYWLRSMTLKKIAMKKWKIRT
jgi:hypothetical protein